ncbi:hypothetical protein [Pendulispora albinea]|uniref:Uncharacterized protein n=1 Tax=Pendulispora albinea TaxID=2741071 RepID=A0ABZ2LJ10_9BACT
MADPRPLFYVASFVIAALALWVISVLARKGEPWARPQTSPHPSEDGRDGQDASENGRES